MYIILSRRKANSDCCRSLLIKSRHHPSSPERKNHVETASNRRRRNIFLLCTDLLPAASFACDSPGISASAGPFTPSFVGPCASEQRTAPRLPFFPASISDFTTIHRVIRRLGLGPLRPPSLPCASRRALDGRFLPPCARLTAASPRSSELGIERSRSVDAHEARQEGQRQRHRLSRPSRHEEGFPAPSFPVELFDPRLPLLPLPSVDRKGLTDETLGGLLYQQPSRIPYIPHPDNAPRCHR